MSHNKSKSSTLIKAAIFSARSITSDFKYLNGFEFGHFHEFGLWRQNRYSNFEKKQVTPHYKGFGLYSEILNCYIWTFLFQ